MMLTHEVATVWWERGVPDRMVWRDRRWRVSDTPTRLTATAEFLPSAMTHAPERTVGWRFQVPAPRCAASAFRMCTDSGVQRSLACSLRLRLHYAFVRCHLSCAESFFSHASSVSLRSTRRA